MDSNSKKAAEDKTETNNNKQEKKNNGKSYLLFGRPSMASTSGFTGLERNLFDGSDVKRCWHQQSDQFTKAEQLTRGETRPNT